MNQTNFSYSKVIDTNFSDAVNKMKAALKEEGFGIMTEINVQEKMKEKLGLQIEPYIILGTCNPNYAYQALQKEIQMGLFLPCKIIIFQKDGITHASAIRPSKTMDIVDNPEVASIAKEVEKKLKSVIETL